MANKKEAKKKTANKAQKAGGKEVNEITNAAELKIFLENVREKLSEKQSPPLSALVALRSALNRPDVYSLLDNDNRELARDIFLRLKQAGLHVPKPRLLFSAEELEASAS